MLLRTATVAFDDAANAERRHAKNQEDDHFADTLPTKHAGKFHPHGNRQNYQADELQELTKCSHTVMVFIVESISNVHY